MGHKYLHVFCPFREACPTDSKEPVSPHPHFHQCWFLSTFFILSIEITKKKKKEKKLIFNSALLQLPVRLSYHKFLVICASDRSLLLNANSLITCSASRTAFYLGIHSDTKPGNPPFKLQSCPHHQPSLQLLTLFILPQALSWTWNGRPPLLKLANLPSSFQDKPEVSYPARPIPVHCLREERHVITTRMNYCSTGLVEYRGAMGVALCDFENKIKFH